MDWGQKIWVHPTSYFCWLYECESWIETVLYKVSSDLFGLFRPKTICILYILLLEYLVKARICTMSGAWLKALNLACLMDLVAGFWCSNAR